jgi:hypothetical protein
MIKNYKGTSLIEIIVSMVVLAIVVLAMTKVITRTSLQHRQTNDLDISHTLAQTKLVQLQDASQFATGGADTISYSGIDYFRNWVIATGTPVLATVEVSFNLNGSLKTVNIAGYLESGNVCQEIVDNIAPSSILVLLADETEVDEGDDITLSLGTNVDEFVAVVYGVDSDTVKGDVVKLKLVSGAEDNDKFSLTRDTIYTNQIMDQDGVNYTIIVEAVDCAGNSITREINVLIPIVLGKPAVLNPQEFYRDENISASDFVAQLTAEEDESDISWTDITTDFITSYDGKITLGINTPFNHESSDPVFTFDAVASRGELGDGMDSIITVIVHVSDINEAPSSISISNNTLVETAEADSPVATITAFDVDSTGASPTEDWYNNTLEYSGSSNYEIEGTDKLVVADGASLSPGVDSVFITARDDYDADLYVVDTFEITVSSEVASECGYGDWFSNNSYATGDMVYHIDRLWRKTTEPDDNAEPYSGSEMWWTAGFCEPKSCSDFSTTWSLSTAYSAPYGDVVIYQSKIYVSIASSQGNSGKPSLHADKWDDLGGCSN